MKPKHEIAEKIARLGRNYYPTVAFYEVTMRCNASCGYCYIKNEDPKRELDTAECLKVIDVLYNSGILALHITGGEPFVRDDILSILSAVFERDFFLFTIMTNGIAVNRRHLDFIVKNSSRINKVHLSAFSHDAKMNDRFMGVDGALEKIIETGLLLLEAGIPVELGVNVLDFNVVDIVKTKDFFTEHGFRVNTAIGKHLTTHELRRKFLDSSSEEFYRKALAPFMGNQPIHEIHDDDATKAVCANEKICGNLHTGISVDCAGDIHPCLAFRQLAIGSVLDSRGLREVLRSSRTLKEVTLFSRDKVEKCRNCSYSDECSFCPGMFGDFLNGDGPQPYQCNLTRAAHAVRCGK